VWWVPDRDDHLTSAKTRLPNRWGRPVTESERKGHVQIHRRFGAPKKGAAWQRFFNTPLKVFIDIQAT
jgi:hypothetical protein